MSESQWHKHMARVYLTQARSTPHPEFRATLVKWARNRFRQYLRKEGTGQMDIFGSDAE